MILLYLLLLLLVREIIFVYLKAKFKNKLNKSRILYFSKKIKILSEGYFSSREKILDYDKFYHLILKDIGYTGTFADILKKEPPEIDNINNIWEFHKLRNKLAHEINDISEDILAKKAIEFEKELLNLLNKFN